MIVNPASPTLFSAPNSNPLQQPEQPLEKEKSLSPIDAFREKWDLRNMSQDDVFKMKDEAVNLGLLPESARGHYSLMLGAGDRLVPGVGVIRANPGNVDVIELVKTKMEDDTAFGREGVDQYLEKLLGQLTVLDMYLNGDVPESV